MQFISCPIFTVFLSSSMTLFASDTKNEHQPMTGPPPWCKRGNQWVPDWPSDFWVQDPVRSWHHPVEKWSSFDWVWQLCELLLYLIKQDYRIPNNSIIAGARNTSSVSLRLGRGSWTIWTSLWYFAGLSWAGQCAHHKGFSAQLLRQIEHGWSFPVELGFD